MSKLTEMLKWAFTIFEEMLAHLSLIFLLKCVEMTLTAVEVVIVRLLGQVLQDFTWRVVEVSWSSLRVQSFALILGLWLALRVKRSR